MTVLLMPSFVTKRQPVSVFSAFAPVLSHSAFASLMPRSSFLTLKYEPVS